MAKIEPANLLLKDKNGNTGLVKSLTNKDIATLKNVVTNVDYIKDFVNANGGSLPVQGDIHLAATDEEGNNGKILLGTSSGILQWNNQNLVRSVNGVNADAQGNVQTGFPSGTFVTIFENITNKATASSSKAYKNSYTAPANGFVCCKGKKNNNTIDSACYVQTDRLCSLYSSGVLASPAEGLWVGGTIPVKKGEIISFLILNLNSAGAEFIYAQGEEP